jgi:hypothetical protein
VKLLRIIDYSSKGVLSFDLKDLLDACHHYADRKWVAWQVECSGTDWYSTFHDAPNEQITLVFEQVKNYAEETIQTSDGIFFAVKPNITEIPLFKKPEDCIKYSDVMIRAADATWFDVVTDDENVVSKLLEKFKNAKVEVLTDKDL